MRKTAQRHRSGRKRLNLLVLGLMLVSVAGLRVIGRSRGRIVHATTFPTGSRARLYHLVDGDTAYFQLTEGGQLVKGRLAGINAPECHKREIRHFDGFHSTRCDRDAEYYGLQAYRQLQRLLDAGAIRLDCERRPDGRCRTGIYDRVLLEIAVHGRDVATAMVASGAAFTFTRYPSSHRAQLCQAELEARRRRVGMWAVGPIPAVLARMSAKTRRWYARHDKACQRALAKP